MNYLQLTQRLREKVGGAGEGPDSVENQRGEYSRYVNWINEAWSEIQNFRPDWGWMHLTAVNPMVVGTSVYNDVALGVPHFNSWDLRDAKISDVSAADEKRLIFLPYDLFKQRYGYGVQAEGRPAYISRDIANNLVFFPVPDKSYTLTTDYFQSAIPLVVNTDVPAMPSSYHMAIVYKAMEYAGRFENAGEVVQDGVIQYAQIFQRLESNQLPEITAGAPLL